MAGSTGRRVVRSARHPEKESPMPRAIKADLCIVGAGSSGADGFREGAFSHLLVLRLVPLFPSSS